MNPTMYLADVSGLGRIGVLISSFQMVLLPIAIALGVLFILDEIIGTHIFRRLFGGLF